VNSDETTPENVPENLLFLKRCVVCDTPHVRSGEICSSRECRMRMTEFIDFTTLGYILGRARWAGAPSQEEMNRECYRVQLRAAIKRLPHGEDLLFAALCEIIEDLEEAEGVEAVQAVEAVS
jgi:hypothetical protein